MGSLPHAMRGPRRASGRWPAEQILDDFPTLSADDVRAAIAIAATSAQEDLPVPATHVR
ncbi:MAG TPA: hypothetical protein VMO26_15460 [Vicinamibacterales bacterium]|nr:hypothetical protein [Vicinamibacterales bacterium]